VTWNTTAGLDSRTEYHHCPVNDIRIRLPKNVEKCNLVITITAGNSVGMSSPTMFTSKLITIFPSSTNEATVLQDSKGALLHCVLIDSQSIPVHSFLPSCQECKHLSVVCRLSVCPVKKIKISRFTGLNDS